MDTVTIQTLIEAYSPDLYQQPTPWYGCVVSHELYAQIQEAIPTQRRIFTRHSFRCKEQNDEGNNY